jgi:hypothetical protein
MFIGFTPEKPLVFTPASAAGRCQNHNATNATKHATGYDPLLHCQPPSFMVLLSNQLSLVSP